MVDESKQSGSAKASGEEVIDLEGIVRDIDLTPTDGVKPPPTQTSEPLHAEALSEDKIEELLMTESPELAAEMAAIREIGTAQDQEEIKTLEQEDAAAEEALQGRSRMTTRERISFQLLKLLSWLKSMKDLAKHAARDLKGVLREIANRSKLFVVTTISDLRTGFGKKLKWLKSRSLAQKLSLVFAAIAVTGLVLVANNTIHGTLLPKTEKLWVANFADHADGTFTYDTDGPFEDFNDPLLHPEFVVMIPRMVVNLARSEDAADGANPMAAFEIYLQTDNQEAAIEINDRSVEIRDSLSRAVERMTYDALVGEEGKAKLKLLIRRDLNALLTKGKVRRVFFKTIVLNPE